MTMKAVFKDNHIDLEGFSYFTGKASSVTFGCYGDKHSPAFDPNFLAVWDVLPGPKLAGLELTTTALTVEIKDTQSLGLMAAVLVPGLASGKVGLNAGHFGDGIVKLVKVSPRGDKGLVEAINASPKVKDKLIQFGGSARVVVDVLIAVEAKKYSKFAAGIGARGAVIIDGVMVRAGAQLGADRETEVGITPGTVIGYSLAEPKWNATRDKNKTQVETLRPDWQGL
jgi:hypothetical protein